MHWELFCVATLWQLSSANWHLCTNTPLCASPPSTKHVGYDFFGNNGQAPWVCMVWSMSEHNMFLGERRGLTARSHYKKEEEKSTMCWYGEGIPHGVEVGVNLILDDHEQGSSRDQMTAVGWHLKNVVRRQLDNWVFQVNQPPVFWAFCVKGTGATFGVYQIFWWCVMGKLVSLDKELLSKTSYTYIYIFRLLLHSSLD